MQKDRASEARWIEKENRWCIQVQSNGIRRRFYSSIAGAKGKVQAERKADEWLSEDAIYGKMTVERAWKGFIEYMHDEDLQTHQYESIGKVHILPAISRFKVSSLTEFDLQRILTNGYNKGLSQKSLKNIRGCISSFLKYCRMCRYTTLHPENVKINKKAKKPNKKTMQPDEIKVLFSSDRTVWQGKECFDWYVYAYRFQASTGLRPSELLGLKRSDVDEQNKTITIRGGYLGRGQFSAGKTENATRTICMNDISYTVYKKQIEMLDGNKKVVRKCPYLFPDRDGKICEQRTLLRNFSRYCETNGIQHYTMYELRHTYISVNRYMPEALLKLQVGHSEKMNTRGVYGHEIDGDARRASELSTAAFNEILGITNGIT